MSNDNLHSGHRERMFKKFLANGIDCFADHEKLEILLYYILPRVDTNKLAHTLINRFGSLQGVFNATKSELEEITDIGPYAALKIHFLRDFFNFLHHEKPELIVIDSIDKATSFCRNIFDLGKSEEMAALFLDKKSNLIARYKVKGQGSDAVKFDIKEFSRQALESKCSRVILAHSHMYMPLLPSDSDIITTRNIGFILKTFGISLIDHIILNDWSEYSMRSSGDLLDIWS